MVPTHFFLYPPLSPSHPLQPPLPFHPPLDCYFLPLIISELQNDPRSKCRRLICKCLIINPGASVSGPRTTSAAIAIAIALALAIASAKPPLPVSPKQGHQERKRPKSFPVSPNPGHRKRPRRATTPPGHVLAPFCARQPDLFSPGQPPHLPATGTPSESP